MTEARVPAALSIGAVLGDSDTESLAWQRAVGALGQRVMAARKGVTSPLNVNVVFHIDGRLVPNDFVGVRTGRFDRRRSVLQVQASIQPGRAELDRVGVLAGLLLEAIDEAELFAREKRLAQDLGSIRRLVAELPSD